MLTSIVLMVGLVFLGMAAGVVLGRYPDLLRRNMGLILSAPRLLVNGLFRLISSKPQLCASFGAGFLVGLLVSGTLTKIFWTATLMGLVLLGLLLIFPKRGPMFLRGSVKFSGRCVKYVRDFFA